MQILFKSRHPEAALMRDTVERRVRFALRRLNALVPRADVQLADVNGPRGGLDKRCQIALRTDGAGEVVVSSVAGDWRTALDEALARAVRHPAASASAPAPPNRALRPRLALKPPAPDYRLTALPARNAAAALCKPRAHDAPRTRRRARRVIGHVTRQFFRP